MKTLFTILSIFTLSFVMLLNCAPGKNAEQTSAAQTATELKDADAQLKIKTEQSLAELADSLKAGKIEPADMYGHLKKFLEQNSDILASVFAYSPKEENGQLIKNCPYVYRKDNQFMEKNLQDSYDYIEQKWYSEAVKTGQPVWSAPYYDEGGYGADVLMTTYSIPLFTDEDKTLIGVLTADLFISKKNN